MNIKITQNKKQYLSMLNSMPETEALSPISLADNGNHPQWTGWGTSAPDPVRGQLDFDKWLVPERENGGRSTKISEGKYAMTKTENSSQIDGESGSVLAK